MADIIGAIVAHCRADATLTGLVPAAQIDLDLEPDTTTRPFLMISHAGNGPVAHCVQDHRVLFTVKNTKTGRNALIAIRDRLLVMFQNKGTFSVGTTGDLLISCSNSYLESGGIPERESPAGPWYFDAYFNFRIADTI